MKNLKILYIDNKSEVRTILNHLLEYDYDVRFVESIHDAKTQILLEKFDLLITEVELNNDNGLDFIEEIRKTSNIKTIVVSSNQEPKTLLKALSLKIEKYLIKPIDLDELISSIKSCFSLRDSKNKNTKQKELELSSGFVFNSSKNILVNKNGTNVELTQQELTLLKALIKQKNFYCSHSSLQVSIGTVGESATIETLRTVIKKIRKKTSDTLIESLSGIGYKVNTPTVKNKYDISSLITIKKIEKKVLIAKGNEKNNKTLQKHLQEYGFICEEVFFLEDVKKALEHDNFDYIVIDLELPDGDSSEILRDKNIIKSNKIIVLSDSEDIHYKEYLYFKGIVDYIEKRNDLDYLAYLIYQTVSKLESNHINNSILLVESSKKIAEQIKDLLLPRNYNIDITRSAEQVINLVHHKSYNLIILDLELEGINSLDFLITLKTQVDKSLPIIMLSGAQRSYSTVRECYINGAVECLRKPIFAEEFILKTDQWSEYYKQTLEIKDKHRLLDSYKSIVDKTVIVSKTDSNGIITYVNDMFCDISQYSRAELIGQAHSIVRHPEMLDSYFKDMWKTISKEKKVWKGVLKNRKKDGSFYLVSTYIMPILDYNNDIIEYIALRNDITTL